jgi:predicted XRE-type DNA-binding protein
LKKGGNVMDCKWISFSSSHEAEKLISISDMLVDIMSKENLSYREAVTVLEITQERLNDTIVSKFGDRSMKKLTAVTNQ